MKKYILVFLASFLVFLGILGGGYLYLNNTEAKLKDDGFDKIVEEYPEIAPPKPEDEKVINTLLMGVDDARSDTMIVARYNKETHQVAMISVPRDTRVNIPGYGYTKVNAAIGKKEGAALAMKTVSNFLDIPIHHYVKVDFKGVIKIVDIMGGVKVNVPPDMDYDDPAQNLHIHIKPGLQNLNGENALKFLRFRSGYPDQDLGRIRAQQEFAKAFIKKLTSPAMLPKAMSLINAMVENTNTNLEAEEIAAYALNLTNINVDQIKIYTVPGKGDNKNGVAYFLHDEKKLREIMAAMNEEIGAVKTDAAQSTSGNTQAKADDSINKTDIKIEILNSTSTKGLASTLKKQLEQKGYTVGKIGDTKDMTYSYSRVIDRRGNDKKLELVSKETGINIIDSDINPSYDYDITIIIGNDRK